MITFFNLDKYLDQFTAKSILSIKSDKYASIIRQLIYLERPEVLEDQEDVVPIDEFHPGSLDDNFLNSNTAKSQHLSSSKAIDSDR